MRALLTTALCVALVLGLTGCTGHSTSKRPVGGGRTKAPTTQSTLARAHALIQNCKVKQTVSLHNGTFYLELRDGSRVNSPKRLERAINAEVAHLPQRCPRILISME